MEDSWHNRARSNPHEEVKAGVSLEDLMRQHWLSKVTFYKWKAWYGGMYVSALKRLQEAEAQNRRLKQMYADLRLEHKALNDIVEKSCRA